MVDNSQITGQQVPPEEAPKKTAEEQEAAKTKAESERKANVAAQNAIDFANRKKLEDANKYNWPNWSWKPISPAQKDAALNAEMGVQSAEGFTLLKEGVYTRNPPIAGQKRFDVALVKNPDGSFTAASIPQPELHNKKEFIQALNAKLDGLIQTPNGGTVKFLWKKITKENLQLALALAEQKGLSVIEDPVTTRFMQEELSAEDHQYFKHWFERLKGNQILNQLGRSSAIDKLNQDLKKADLTEKYGADFTAPTTLPPNQTVEQAKRDYALTKYKESLEKDENGVEKSEDDQIAALIAEKEKLKEEYEETNFLSDEIKHRLSTPDPLLENIWQMQDPEKEAHVKDMRRVSEEVAAAIVATKAPPEQAVQNVAGTEAIRNLSKPSSFRDAIRNDPIAVVGKVEKYMKDGEPQRDEAVRLMEKKQEDLEARRKIVDDKLKGFEDALTRKADDIELRNRLAAQRAQQTGEEVPPPDTLSEAEKQRKTKISEARHDVRDFKEKLEKQKTKVSEVKELNAGFAGKLDRVKTKIEEDRVLKQSGRPILK